MNRETLQEMLAEFLGTFVLIAIGLGSVAMVVLFDKGVPGGVTNGGFTNITFAWGLAVTFGIYVAGMKSGAHLNPAVTLSLALLRGFSWKKVPFYVSAQFLGAMAGAAVIYFIYREQFLLVDPDLQRTAGVFCTFPAFPGNLWVGFWDQFFGTALLVLLVFSVVDDLNQAEARPFAPLVIGLIVVAIGMSFGSLHGYAINPARDLGPRLVTAMVGFKNNGLTDGTSVFWIPVLGPLLGGPIGGLIYDLMIRKSLLRSREAGAK
ncbi:MAG: aquaporin family protein [Bdellovibrionales bacterium]|nr:aquaporin family protein [Bdellovibrionales bacterium]